MLKPLRSRKCRATFSNLSWTIFFITREKCLQKSQSQFDQSKWKRLSRMNGTRSSSTLNPSVRYFRSSLVRITWISNRSYTSDAPRLQL